MMDVPEALGQIDHWSRDACAVKVAIVTGIGVVADSGWGGVQTDGVTQLRVVYVRDADGAEVDAVIDVSSAAVSGSSIWDATSLQQEQFGHFDEVIGFSLPDGRTILLMCAMPAQQADN